MKNLSLIAAVAGVGFILLGFFARSPGQTALSNAVMAIGVAMLLFVGVITAMPLFMKRKDGGSSS